MAQIHEAHNNLKEKYEKVRYNSAFDRFLHSPGGNWLCLLFIVISIPVFLFLLSNPGIPLELREKIPFYAAELLAGPIMALHTHITQSLIGLVLFLAVAYFFLRNYFLNFGSFFLFLLALPFGLIMLYTFSQSIIHISVYAFPLLLAFFAWAIRYETKHITRIVTPDSNEGHTLKTGLDGERKALSVLRKLDDRCHIYTNLLIPYRGRNSEADLVLVTPSGVTIVEVKNYIGTLSGDISAENLLYNGEEKYNPVTQVGKHEWRMKGFLRERGISIPVQRCVFFVNPKTRLELTDCDGLIRECPIFIYRDRKELFAYADEDVRCTENAFFRTIEALDALVEHSYERE